MRLRAFRQHDLARLTELTIATFGPFLKDGFRPVVGELVFANQHGDWRGDYRTLLADLHEPDQHKHVVVAEIDTTVAGYVAWSVDPDHRNGRVVILAVDAGHRRHGLGAALCGHALDQMRAAGAEVAVIGTGGDEFHAPARALYESLGCVGYPVAMYYLHL
ncbi:GNAT family N-acetyltransferase [Longispora sp. NPDC051575]|uniref:GNAT family N-acetyltransferase n=1 Tax=Longispora sp. NPDC051575 TaxID=3154943 RepID=UPI003444A8CF